MYEDYAKQVSPRSKLNMQLDEMNRGVETHLSAIAEDLVNLSALTPLLGLKNRHYSDITTAYPGNLPSQRYVLKGRHRARKDIVLPS